MATYRLRITEPRPYFAEVPYYLWGQVNYDSNGNCASPTDQMWTELDLSNRETDEHVEIMHRDDVWEVVGDDPVAARAALFLASRSKGQWIDAMPTESVRNWDHPRALVRADRVRQEFQRPELRPFDVGHYFWGSWKWIGCFATEFTWVGRWIMHSLSTNDKRAVNLCTHWLRQGTVHKDQSQALRFALGRLTGLDFDSDREWVEWYYARGGALEYPEPDFKQWYAELTSQQAND